MRAPLPSTTSSYRIAIRFVVTLTDRFGLSSASWLASFEIIEEAEMRKGALFCSAAVFVLCLAGHSAWAGEISVTLSGTAFEGGPAFVKKVVPPDVFVDWYKY